jgi:hypothetical protein
MIYSNQELREFDRELEKFKIDGKHSIRSLLNYMQSVGAVRIYADGTFAVVADKQGENEPVSVSKYPIVDDKLTQWTEWCGRKEYAQKKDLERLAEQAAKLGMDKRV